MSNCPVMEIFTENVLELVRQTGITFRALSQLSGVDPASLSKILHMKERVTLDRAARIADGLQVPLWTLLRKSENKQKIPA